MLDVDLLIQKNPPARPGATMKLLDSAVLPLEECPYVVYVERKNLGSPVYNLTFFTSEPFELDQKGSCLRFFDLPGASPHTGKPYAIGLHSISQLSKEDADSLVNYIHTKWQQVLFIR